MAVKRLINRVSVDAAFFKKLSPMENLLFAARLYGLDGRTAKREAIAILARLGISEKRIDRPIEQMSRGMQQKVAIARALLTSPTLLLLDEPTTGLDPRSKLDVQTFIEELRETHDATIVLTTHDLAEAERLCGRITILNDGKVVAEDTPGWPQDPHPRSRGRTRDARRRVHDLHRPLPRRRRRGGRRRDRLKGGDNDVLHATSCTASWPQERIEREIAHGRTPAPGHASQSPSIRQRSAAGSSGSVPGSPRNPRSSRLGPAEGPGRLPHLEITPVTVVTHELKASYAFIERNFNLTRRYWGWEVAFLVYSVAGALSISLIGASRAARTLLLSLMVGAIFWNYLSVVFSLDRRDDHRSSAGKAPSSTR